MEAFQLSLSFQMKALGDRRGHQHVLKVQPLGMATCSGVGFANKGQETQEVLQVEEMVDHLLVMVLVEVELVLIVIH